MVGVYYNKAKLTSLGLSVPTSAQQFDAALQKAASSGQQPMVLGNSNKTPGLHAYGLVQGQYATAQSVRDWISGADGATFSTPANVEAAKMLQGWAKEGYFGDGFNGVSEDDGVSRFAAGKSVFLMAGTWNMPTLLAAGAAKFGYFAMPPGDSGKYVATGSLGLGWHISAKTKNLAAAAAFLGMLHDADFAQTLAKLGRVPIVTSGVKAPSELFSEAASGSSRVLMDQGETYSFDWATDTMGSAVQELMDGRLSPTGFCSRLQSNWTSFQDTRK